MVTVNIQQTEDITQYVPDSSIYHMSLLSRSLNYGNKVLVSIYAQLRHIRKCPIDLSLVVVLDSDIWCYLRLARFPNK